MSTRFVLTRQLASYAAASVAISLPWPLLLVLAWDQYGDGPHGPLALGAIGAARMLPYIGLSWVVGSLGDRFRRDRLLLTSLLLRLGCLGALSAAVAAGQLVVAVVAATLAVACATPAYPTLAAAMPQLAGPTRRRATEALVTVEVAAWVVGPAVGGLLLVAGTGPLVPLIAVGLTGAAVALAWQIALPGPATDRPARTAVAAMLRTVLDTPVVLVALGIGGLVNLVGAATSVLLLPLAQDVWQQDERGFGIATAWFGFGALAAPLLWRIRGRRTPAGPGASRHWGWPWPGWPSSPPRWSRSRCWGWPAPWRWRSSARSPR